MPRYIDANNIRLTGLTFTDVNKNVYFSLSDIRKAIEQTPTADVVEVRHGEWKVRDCISKSKRGRTIHYATNQCSVCGKWNGRRKTNYCPNCGAKMDGERKDDNG